MSPPKSVRGPVVQAPAVRLARQYLRHPALLLGTLLAAWAAAASQLALPWTAREWVDALGTQPAPAWPWSLALRTAGLVVALAAASFLARVLFAALTHRVVEGLRVGMVARLIDGPPRVVRAMEAGDLLTRMSSDVGVTSAFGDIVLRRLLGEGAVAAGALVMMLVIDWRVTLAGVAAAPLLGIAFDRVGRRLRGRAMVGRERLGRLGALLQEQLRGLTTIRGFQAEAVEERRFGAASRAHTDAVLSAEALSAGFVASVFMLSGGALLALLWRGASAPLDAPGSRGAFIALVLYASAAVDPLRRLSDVSGGLQVALAAAARLFALQESLPPEARGGITAAVRGDVRFEGVRFRHRPEEPLLEGVDLVLRPGELVALAGRSGAGKSTLAALLPRFVEPTAGAIRLDGRLLSGWDLASLRRAVLVLDQDPHLFSGSLLENLRYGSPEASEDAVRAGAARAGLSALIAERGLHALLQEAGRDLSGGQKQRIALCRALLRDPHVVVLDEALSALDGESEAAVLDALRPWLAERTALVISHRLSTVLRCPRVAVLEEGRVTQVGPAPLIAADPAFRELFGDQWDPLAAAGACA